MIDPVLGSLQPDPDLKGCLLGNVLFDGRQLAIRIDPDDGDLESCLEVGRALLKSLRQFENNARTVAANHLLDSYNDDWRMFQRARADGTMEDIVNPVLSEAEFGARLLLDGLAVTGPMIQFCFSDGGLFAGHSIFVSSFDGTAFTETDATLFG